MKQIMIILALLAGLSCHAQEEADTIAIPKPERISLQYDKPNGCYLGDTVHFTVSLGKDALSRVAYVELIHPTGQVMTSRKLKLDANLSATGYLPVDTLYGSGFYEIRAYTRYLANYDAAPYPHYILPVYYPESKLGKSQSNKYRYICTSWNTEDNASIRYDNVRTLLFNLVQPAEKHLIVFGHIANLHKAVMHEDDGYDNKHFNVVVTKGKQGFTSQAETDVNGYFAVSFPDTLKGEWNLLMYEKRTPEKGVFATDEMTRMRVIYDEDFPPLRARFTPQQYEATNFGFKQWKNDTKQNKAMTRFINCDAAAIRNQIIGRIPQGFYSWLGTIDDRFIRTKGVASPTIMNIAPDSTYNRFLDLNFSNGKNSDDPRTVCVNGPSFKGRPIIWIVNGEYRMVTGLNKRITDFRVLRPSTRHIPQYLDEVRNVFITDVPDAFYSYLRCSVLEKKKPVTIFINTHEGYIWNDSALMTGHFRGYDN